MSVFRYIFGYQIRFRYFVKKLVMVYFNRWLHVNLFSQYPLLSDLVSDDYLANQKRHALSFSSGCLRVSTTPTFGSPTFSPFPLFFAFYFSSFFFFYVTAIRVRSIA